MDKKCIYCGNEIKSGKQYCSRKCAALDRGRKLSITNGVSTTLAYLGANSVVQEEAEILLQETKVTDIPMPNFSGKSLGDWVINYSGHDIKPNSPITPEIIDDMLRSGVVMFAVEMKRAQILSVFRSSTGWAIECQDDELSKVVKTNLTKILPKMMMDISFSSLVYGVSFQELIWENTDTYNLGISKEKKGSKTYTVAKVPNSVNPTTVKHIKRTKDYSYDGFTQYKNSTVPFKQSGAEIEISAMDSLVVPYNDRFRNMWGITFFEPIYPYWFWYEVVLRSMVRYMERMGTPVTVVRAPGKGKSRVPGTVRKEDSLIMGLSIASSVANSNAVVLPSDRDMDGNLMWEISYLSSNEHSEPFISVLENLAQMIFRASLTADRALSQSSGGVGSYAIGTVHSKATAFHNELILTNWVHYLNNYFIPKYGLFNLGVNHPPIWLEVKTLDMESLDLMRTLFGVAASSEAFTEAMKSIDWVKIAEVNNIPVLNDEDVSALEEKLNKQKEEAVKSSMEIMQKKSEQSSPDEEKPNDEDKKENISEKKSSVSSDKKELEQIDKALYLANAVISGTKLPLIFSEDENKLFSDKL